MRGMIGEAEITTAMLSTIIDLQQDETFYRSVLEALDTLTRHYIETIDCTTADQERRSLGLIKGAMLARKALATIHRPEDYDLEENDALRFDFQDVYDSDDDSAPEDPVTLPDEPEGVE